MYKTNDIRLSQFRFQLPEEQIAQEPGACMLVPGSEDDGNRFSLLVCGDTRRRPTR